MNDTLFPIGIDTESPVEDMVEDLTGFHPVMDKLVAAIGELATMEIGPEFLSSFLAVLGGWDIERDGHTDVLGLLTVAVNNMTDPEKNPGIKVLSRQQITEVRGQTQIWVDHVRSITRQVMCEAAGIADPA